jgi:hypothetical protein
MLFFSSKHWLGIEKAPKPAKGFGADFSGAGDRARTYNNWFTKPGLYH